MGTNAVGAMVVAGAAGFMKAHYRTFNIKDAQATPGDDYAMMREVLTRRFARLMKEEAELAAAGADAQAAEARKEFPARPDLVLIDRGKGQFDAARQALADLGVEGVAVVGVAKGADREAGRETFFVEGRAPFKLAPRDPALYFVQRLRDEAHRFAIGTHRARQAKDFLRSGLDDVPGIGPSRKRALLNHFGSAKAVADAGVEDLARVEGISETVARRIYDHFHPRA